MYYYYKLTSFVIQYTPEGNPKDHHIEYLEGPFTSLPELLDSLPADAQGGVKILFIPELM